MKRIVIYSVCLAVLSAAFTACGNKKKPAAEKEAAGQPAAEQVKQDSTEVKKNLSDLAEEPVFNIVTNYGTIKIKLYADTPLHRTNFAKLALSGFYDGLLFHRVIDGFMIQAGDPLTRDMENFDRFGTGGPGYTIPAEFVPEHRHKKGALAAARRGDAANPRKESSGSQFYIVQDEAACAQLDGEYTVFGETIEGLDVVDRIAKVQRDGRDRPVTPVKIIKIELL